MCRLYANSRYTFEMEAVTYENEGYTTTARYSAVTIEPEEDDEAIRKEQMTLVLVLGIFYLIF